MEQKIRKRQSHDIIQSTFVVYKTKNRRKSEVKKKKRKYRKQEKKKKKKRAKRFLLFALLYFLNTKKIFCAFCGLKLIYFFQIQISKVKREIRNI